MITRRQIIEMTKRTGELVASNKVGVAPPNPKHVCRLEALMAEYEEDNARLLEEIGEMQRRADMKETA